MWVFLAGAIRKFQEWWRGPLLTIPDVPLSTPDLEPVKHEKLEELSWKRKRLASGKDVKGAAVIDTRRKQRNQKKVAKDVYNAMQEIINTLATLRHRSGLKINLRQIPPVVPVFCGDFDRAFHARMDPELNRGVFLDKVSSPAIGTINHTTLVNVTEDAEDWYEDIEHPDLCAAGPDIRWALYHIRSMAVRPLHRRLPFNPFEHVLECRGLAITPRGKSYGIFNCYASHDGIVWYEWDYNESPDPYRGHTKERRPGAMRSDYIVMSTPKEISNAHQRWIQTILSTIFSYQQFFWRIRFERRGIRLELPVDRVAAREVLAYRDLEPGQSRRPAAVHWVQGRILNDGSRGAAYLRGRETFTWNGFQCSIIQGQHDQAALASGALPETDPEAFLGRAREQMNIA